MKRLFSLVLIVLLAGCATYDDYAYSDRDYYEDDYYGRYDDRYDDRYYAVRRDYSLGYGSAAYRYPTWDYGYGPDYIVYNSYYSSLWPIYRSYYDPFWSPGFYYGVTYFPRTYFGLNVGWYSWPYYQAYAPYRHSHADHYYDWMQSSRDHAGYVQNHGGYIPRYGSARNQAQYLAERTGARGAVPTYYGASTQPGGIVDPTAARQARVRGQQLPFERGTRDWNIDPYGPDGRGYRGFAEGATDGRTGARQPVYGRGGEVNRGVGESYNSADPTRTGRGYARDPNRESGLVSPTRVQPGDGWRTRREPMRDERNFNAEPQQERSTGDRYYGGRRGSVTAPESGNREFMPRQTRDRYDPMFERHVTPQPQREAQSQFEPRSRDVYRSRPVEQRQSWQQSAPVERSYERSQPRFERSAPAYERSEPAFQRAEPRAAPSYERSEPRSAPSYERSESRSYSPPASRSDDSGRGASSDDGGGRSARGQLDRIIRDE